MAYRLPLRVATGRVRIVLDSSARLHPSEIAMLPRRFTIRLTFATAILLAGTSSACNDRTLISAPDGTATNRFDLKPLPQTHQVVASAAIVRRTKPLDFNETACGTISPEGRPGSSTSISLKNAGLKVTFPTGAVSSPTYVCLTAHAGVLLTYSFYPHGLHFNTDVTVQQTLKGTTAFHNSTLASDLIGGYLANEVATDVDANGVGAFAQVFNVVGADEAGAATNVTPSTAKFYTNHFSGYALASGRQ
jgi:hypothetical protein